MLSVRLTRANFVYENQAPTTPPNISYQAALSPRILLAPVVARKKLKKPGQIYLTDNFVDERSTRSFVFQPDSSS